MQNILNVLDYDMTMQESVSKPRFHHQWLPDVVIFEPKTVGDNATFQNPLQFANGIEHVWVNGTAVLTNGEHTGSFPGRFVKGPGASTNP